VGGKVGSACRARERMEVGREEGNLPLIDQSVAVDEVIKITKPGQVVNKWNLSADFDQSGCVVEKRAECSAGEAISE
jgi:hypothetical protein